MASRMFLALVLAVAMLAGCAQTFTSINKQEDNSYYLTQVKQGPFFMAGSSWKCVPASELVMRCKRVAVP